MTGRDLRDVLTFCPWSLAPPDRRTGGLAPGAGAYAGVVTLSRLALAIAIAVAVPVKAFAADEVRVGKAQGFIWDFLPADVGVAYGIFAKYGLDVKITDLAGDGRVHQALAADSIDFGLGSGPGMAFAAKGSPALAALEGAPRDLCIIVGADSPIKMVADLKGKLVTVSTPDSLSDWLAKSVSATKGWGLDGIRRLVLGAAPGASPRCSQSRPLPILPVRRRAFHSKNSMRREFSLPLTDTRRTS